MRSLWDTHPKWVPVGLVAIGCIVTSIWIMPLATWYFTPRPAPPVIFLSAELLTPVIPVGGVLRFRIHSKVSARDACFGQISREFSRMGPSGIREKWRGPLTGPPIARHGETEYDIMVPVLPEMTAGDWFFTGITLYDCHGEILRFQTADVRFTMTEKAQ